MEIRQIRTIEELRTIAKEYNNDCLFRGQTKHYFDASSAPNIPTSFERHGCIPPLMFKWTHYAKAIVRAFGGGRYDEIGVEVIQAILQHYGWRSFYIDLTKSLHVAAWFASHKYSDELAIDMCENVDEDPVWLVHRRASYAESTENKGHLYVVSIASLAKAGVHVHDLTQISAEDATLRFHAQEACLAGHTKRLPPEAVVAHLVVDSAVLVQFAEEAGFASTEALFPPQSRDIVLRALLATPWRRISQGDETIPAFKRGLDLPEYDMAFVKHLSPSTILYEPFWVADLRDEEESPLSSIPFYRIPEYDFYVRPTENSSLPEVTKLLATCEGFAIELDGIVRQPEFLEGYVCEKGVIVHRLADNLYEISALSVGHPTNVLESVGRDAGWVYHVDGTTWTKVDHNDSCPCNNDLRHELHFSLLKVFDLALSEKSFAQIDALNYVGEGVRSTPAGTRGDSRPSTNRDS